MISLKPHQYRKVNLEVKAQGGRNEIELNPYISISCILLKVMWSSEEVKGISCKDLLWKVIYHSLLPGRNLFYFPFQGSGEGRWVFLWHNYKHNWKCKQFKSHHNQWEFLTCLRKFSDHTTQYTQNHNMAASLQLWECHGCSNNKIHMYCFCPLPLANLG